MKTISKHYRFEEEEEEDDEEDEKDEKEKKYEKKENLNKIDYNEKQGILDASFINKFKKDDVIKISLTKLLKSPVNGINGKIITCLFLDNNYTIKELIDPELIPNLKKLLASQNKINKVPYYEKLTYLDVSDNLISDLSNWSNHYNVEHIDCSNNPISGKVRFNLPKCKRFSARNCFINKPFLFDMNNCKSLKSLYLDNNNITDVSNFCCINTLKVLVLTKNKLRDSGITTLDYWPLLKELNLSENVYLTTLPNSFSVVTITAELCNLRQIGSHYNNLKYLNVDKNKIKKLIIKNNYLEYISAKSNILTTVILPQNTKFINLSDNNLSSFNLPDNNFELDLTMNINLKNLTNVNLNNILTLGTVKLNYNLWVKYFLKYIPLVKIYKTITKKKEIINYFDNVYSNNFKEELKKNEYIKSLQKSNFKPTINLINELTSKIKKDDLIKFVYDSFKYVNKCTSDNSQRKDKLKNVTNQIVDKILSTISSDILNNQYLKIKKKLYGNIKALYYQSLSINLIFNCYDY